MKLNDHEPIDGDFARYVESLAGRTGTRAQARADDAIRPVAEERTAARKGAGLAEARPVPAEASSPSPGVGADARVPAPVARALYAVLRRISSLAIAIGTGWIAVAILAQDHQWIEPLPGFVLLFLGIAARTRLPAARAPD